MFCKTRKYQLIQAKSIKVKFKAIKEYLVLVLKVQRYLCRLKDWPV